MPTDGREPTMEEILASIRRIIAEEDEVKPRKAQSAEAAVDDEAADAVSDVAQTMPSREEAVSTEVPATSDEVSDLSAMLVGGESGTPNTLEEMVREMLRPMLKQWLDAKLPEMVEQMVASEIARITRK